MANSDVTKPSISVVVPVYNERTRLGPAIEQLVAFVVGQVGKERHIDRDGGWPPLTCQRASRSEKARIVEVCSSHRCRLFSLDYLVNK